MFAVLFCVRMKEGVSITEARGGVRRACQQGATGKASSVERGIRAIMGSVQAARVGGRAEGMNVHAR